MRPRNPYLRDLSTLHWDQLEQKVQEFEDVWRHGERPELDRYLSGEGPGHWALLIELVHADLEFRLKAGEGIRIETYLQRYPELGREREVVIALLASELLLRRRTEPHLNLEELLQRFPECRPELTARLRALGLEIPAGEGNGPAVPGPVSPAESVSPGSTTEVHPHKLLDHEADRADLPTVPGYKILGVLGRGGMGVVYKAEHLRLQRVVALKMIRGGPHAGAELLARFRTEALAVARLQHPNIVQIHEVGEHEQLPYFSLEFVEGDSLASKLDGTPVDGRQAAELIEILARAIHVAHQRGIVHRDLKPSNVLLTVDGQAKITDFGLAKQQDDDSDQTRTGAILGTPSYMAPEQAAGRGKEVGPLADVWALGVMLYEMLVGRRPFCGGPDHDTLNQVLYQDPVAPRRLQPKVARDLETICLKCLEKEPARRYLSAQDLAADLHRFLTDHPILARPVGMATRALKWGKRRPVGATLVVGSLFTLLFLLGTWIFFTFQIKDALDQRTTELLREQEKNEEKTREYQRFIRQNLYLSDVRLAYQLWGSGEDQLARETLLRQIPASTEEDFRGFEWLYLHRQCDHEPRILKLPGCGTSLAYAADGKTLASAGSFDRILLWDLTNDQIETELPLSSKAGNKIAWSPDGKMLGSIQQGGTIQLWHLNGTGKRARLAWTSQQEALPGAVAFSPDGSYLTTSSGALTRIWDAATGQLHREFPAFQFAFAPDGKALAGSGHGIPLAGTVDTTWKVWDLTTRQQRLHVDHLAYCDCLLYSPDGRFVFTGDRSGEITQWESTQGQRVASLKGHNGRVLALAVSADGQLLASAGEDATIRLWDVQPQLRLRVVLRGHAGPVFHVTFSPDGRQLASTGEDGSIRLWDVQRFRIGERLQARIPAAGPLVFAPDGKTLVLAGKDQSLCRVDTRTLQVHRRWTSNSLNVRAMVYSADNQWFADNQWLAVAGNDGLIRIWDPQEGRLLATLAGHKEVSSLATAPKGREVLSGGRDGIVKLWDLATREPRTFRQGPGEIASVACSPDGRFVAAGGHVTTAAGREGMVQCWDKESGQEHAFLKYKDPVLSVTFTHKGPRLVSSTLGGEAALWDLGQKQVIGKFSGFSYSIRSLNISPDDRFLGGVEGQTLFLWDLSSRRLEKRISGVRSFAFSPAGNMLATSDRDGRVFLWDLGTWKMRPLDHQPPGQVHSLAFSEDGRQLITGSSEPPSTITSFRHLPFLKPTDNDRRVILGSASGAVRTWNVATRQQGQTLPTPDWALLHCLALSPKGSLLAAGGNGWISSWDGEARSARRLAFVSAKAESDWQDVEPIVKLFPAVPYFPITVRALAITPGGKLLATAYETREHHETELMRPTWTVQLWDGATGKELATLPAGTHESVSLAISPHGTILAFNEGSQIKLWDVDKREIVARFQAANALVRSLAFSSDGQTLGVGSEDRHITLWDLTGNKQADLTGHTDAVMSLAFSSDGKTLASGSLDGTVQLWNPTLGQYLGTLGTTGKVLTVAFSPDGALLASGGEDLQGLGEVILWQAGPRTNP